MHLEMPSVKSRPLFLALNLLNVVIGRTRRCYLRIMFFFYKPSCLCYSAMGLSYFLMSTNIYLYFVTICLYVAYIYQMPGPYIFYLN